MNKEYFQFMKVDNFFKDISNWNTLRKVVSYEWNQDTMTLTLNLEAADHTAHSLLIQVPSSGILRVRFHPGFTQENYARGNTRSIVLDEFQKLVEKNKIGLEVSSCEQVEGQKIVFTMKNREWNYQINVSIAWDPFTLSAVRQMEGKKDEIDSLFFLPEDSICFTSSGGLEDYKIIQSVKKSWTAKYIGFGEQGGLNLVKNNTRITYFNYDNMRYRQVYDRGPLEEREPLYHSDPFFMEVNGNPGKDSAYGVYIDNPSEVFMDMGYYNSTEYRFGTRYGDMDYYIFIGNCCADIIQEFSDIIGTARLIPRYALGYHQGCYGYEKRQDVEEAVNNYRKYQIPIDGIHIDVDLQKNYKTFTIDESKFQNPKEMFQWLKDRGIKCSTNITPIISNRDGGDYTAYQEGMEQGYFVKDVRFEPEEPEAKIYHKYASGKKYEYEMNDRENNFNSGRPFIGEVYYGNNGGVELGTTGHYPDLNRKEVRIWWGKQYQYLFDMGLEMVWQDMTTPCIRDTRGDMLSFPARLMIQNDYIKKTEEEQSYEQIPVIKIWNLYSYNLHKATYHGLNYLKGRENKRNFIIGRGCFTGMQRFAGLWTGDNSSSWDFLRINISQILALGLTGQALSGQDIGGFEREYDWEKWADPELLIRWTAMGAFLPWFRNHYIRKGKKLFQEPYEYQFHADEVGNDVKYLYEAVLPVSKYFIELRYRLMQLFYDAMVENTRNGMPICRAMFLTDPKDMAVFNDKVEFLDNQFLVRKDLLIAPVVEKQSYENGYGKRDVYLPYGSNWYQFMDQRRPLGSPIKGGTIIPEFDASINGDEAHLPFIVPMYVREGAVIPMIELEQYVGEKNKNGQPNPITFYIYPGEEGSYTMYLDDGISRSSAPEGSEEYGTDPMAKGEYRETLISHCYGGERKRQITVERIHDNYTPQYEDYFMVGVLHCLDEGENPIQTVTINGVEGNAIAVSSIEDLKESPANTWYYDSHIHTSYIKVLDDSPSIHIILEYEK